MKRALIILGIFLCSISLASTKSYVTAKIGATYKFNSGKGFRTPRIERNSDNSRFSKE